MTDNRRAYLRNTAIIVIGVFLIGWSAGVMTEKHLSAVKAEGRSNG